MEAFLSSITPGSVALVQYKKTVVRDLAIAMRQLGATTRFEDELHAELLSQLPEPVSPVSEEEPPFMVPATTTAAEL